MNLRKLFTLTISLAIYLNLKAEIHYMIGYVDMREAHIWLMTDQSGEVEAEVRLLQKPEVMRYSVQVDESRDLTAELMLTGLEPGSSYQFRLKEKRSGKDGLFTPWTDFTTQALWQFRTDPPAFRLAMGSCAFLNEAAYDRPGKPYGGDYQIFDSIASKKPDAMLWLGDNIYLREVDFNSYSGIIHRYKVTRKTPELQRLLHACPNIAIWDDHDFGPNDANGSYIHKDWTLRAFKEFWANPSYGLPSTAASDGITGQCSFSDVEIFMLDNRYHRTLPDLKGGAQPTVFGKDQLEWLIQALKTSRAPFKLVAMGGQFLNSVEYPDNFSTYPEERAYILKQIADNGIKGVVILSGDRHCGEMSQYPIGENNMVYELTVSPLTSGAYDITKEENTYRVEGTITPKRHFATLDFSGKAKERKMLITVWDSNGVELWKKEIEQPK